MFLKCNLFLHGNLEQVEHQIFHDDGCWRTPTCSCQKTRSDSIHKRLGRGLTRLREDFGSLDHATLAPLSSHHCHSICPSLEECHCPGHLRPTVVVGTWPAPSVPGYASLAPEQWHPACEILQSQDPRRLPPLLTFWWLRPPLSTDAETSTHALRPRSLLPSLSYLQPHM